jgi:hypothetical protein
MTARACSQCGASITRLSKSGLCRPHAIARMHADPAYRAKRAAAVAAHFAKPGVRQAWGAHLHKGLAAYRANMSDEDKQRWREHGMMLVREYLSRPDIRARALSAEARAKAAAGYVETCLGWCPVDLRDAYRDLVVRKRFHAAEAREIISALIPGTIERGRVEVANSQLASRLRHERQQAEAY